MVKSIVSIRSRNDGVVGKQISFRVVTDSAGFIGKAKVKIGAVISPDVDVAITGENSVRFFVDHTQTGLAVVKISADGATSTVVLDLDQQADP
jgi:hypothetical protein